MRYDVQQGKGVLRVAWPEGLADPPAAVQSEERGLGISDLLACRFTHVEPGGGPRRTWSLSGIPESYLDDLPIGSWMPLRPHGDGQRRLLVLDDPLETGDAGTTFTEEPSNLDTNADPGHLSRMDQLRRVLAEPRPGPTRVSPGPHGTVLRERSWDHTRPTPTAHQGGPATSRDTGPDDADVYERPASEIRSALKAQLETFFKRSPRIGPSEGDDAAATITDVLESLPIGPAADASIARVFPEDAPDAQGVPSLGGSVPPEAQVPPGPASLLDILGNEPMPGLIRYLRRRQLREQADIQVLKSRIAELEARLSDRLNQAGTPIQENHLGRS